MKIKKQFSAFYFLKRSLYFSFALTTMLTAKNDMPAEAAVVELETYADYKKMMSNPKPSIVMVHATWCGACKGFKPTFKGIAEKYQKDANFYLLNESVKELQKELAAFNVQGFPTILYIKKDLGGAPEAMFDAKIRDFLNLPEVKVAEPKKEVHAKKEDVKSVAKELTTQKEYSAMLQSKKPCAVLLYASWCGACSMFKPAFHEVANKRSKDMNFYLLDVDNAELNKEIAGFNVEGIPTTIFFKKNGKKLVEDSKMVGARPADNFEAEINKVLNKKAPAKQEATKKVTKKDRKSTRRNNKN